MDVKKIIEVLDEASAEIFGKNLGSTNIIDKVYSNDGKTYIYQIRVAY